MRLFPGRPATELGPVLDSLAGDPSPLGEGWRLLGRGPTLPGPLLFATPTGELVLCLLESTLDASLLSRGLDLLAMARQALPLYQACPPPDLPAPRSARLLLIGGALTAELLTAATAEWTCLLVCEVTGQPGPPLVLLQPLAPSIHTIHKSRPSRQAEQGLPPTTLADEEVSRLVSWGEEPTPRPGGKTVGGR